MPRDFSSPGIGGLCNSSRPPSAKNVATLDISHTGTGRGGLTSQPNRIRYSMNQRRYFQATVSTCRTATVLSSHFQSRCQVLRRYIPPPPWYRRRLHLPRAARELDVASRRSERRIKAFLKHRLILRAVCSGAVLQRHRTQRYSRQSKSWS